MVTEGFIPIEARSGHHLVAVSVTGGGGVFKETPSLLAVDVFPGRASMGMKPAATVY